MKSAERPYTGLTASVKIGSDSDAEVIAYVSGVDLTLEREMTSYTPLGQKYKKQNPATESWSASIDGTVAFAEGGTQQKLYDAFDDGTAIVIGVYFDSNTYFQGTGYVSSFSFNLAPDDKVTLSADIEGTDSALLKFSSGAPEPPPPPVIGTTDHRELTNRDAPNQHPISAIEGLETKLSTIPKNLSQLTGDATHRVVTDAEKTTWNGKSNFSGKWQDLQGKPEIPTKLPNPYGIIFNGAVSATYDGSRAVTVTIPQGGGSSTGGTTDHRQLTHRDDADQHKIQAITGLQSALNDKQDKGDYALKTDKLANPHALTINGQQYDGSKDVSVEIKGGEGSSASSVPFTNSKFVVEQAVDTIKIPISRDCHELYVSTILFGDTKNSNSIVPYMYIETDTKSDIGFALMAKVDNKEQQIWPFDYFSGKIENGVIFAQASSQSQKPPTDAFTSAATRTDGRNGTLYYLANTIKAIRLQMWGAVFGVGTTIFYSWR